MQTRWRLPKAPVIPASKTPASQPPEQEPTSSRSRSRGGHREPAPSREPDEKLYDILGVIQGADWSLGEFLHQLFQPIEKARPGKPEHATHIRRRVQMLSKYLSGERNFTALSTVELIFNHPYSRPSSDFYDARRYFATDVHSSEILFARPALTTWARELVSEEIRRESTRLIAPESGLRVHATRKRARRKAAAPAVVPGALPGMALAPAGTSSAPGTAQLVSSAAPAAWRAAMSVASGAAASIATSRVVPSVVGGADTELLAAMPDADNSMDVDVRASDTRPPSVPEDVARAVRGQVDGNNEDEDESAASETEDEADDGATQPEAGGQEPRKKDPTVSWDLVSKFSLASLQEKYKQIAPVTWQMVWGFMKPDDGDPPRTYRPIHIVSTSIISEMVYGRNQYANLFALCRGISLFSMKAHHSIFRVGSRLAQSVPYATMRRALVTMAEEKRAAWIRDIKNGVHKFYLIVLDNIQAYAQRRDQHIRNGNEMIIGTGGTAIEMQNVTREDLRLDALEQQRAKGERRNMTVESILGDIDVEHLDRIASYHWLDALVHFVPALAAYRPMVSKLFEDKAAKHQINPTRKSKIHPLGTNSANEVTTHGMKEAVSDFIDQIGITEDTYGGNITFVTGDGKLFEGLNKVKKYLHGEGGTLDVYAEESGGMDWKAPIPRH